MKLKRILSLLLIAVLVLGISAQSVLAMDEKHDEETQAPPPMVMELPPAPETINEEGEVNPPPILPAPEPEQITEAPPSSVQEPMDTPEEPAVTTPAEVPQETAEPEVTAGPEQPTQPDQSDNRNILPDPIPGYDPFDPDNPYPYGQPVDNFFPPEFSEEDPFGIVPMAQGSIPNSMWDNSILRALAYTGFDVQYLKDKNYLYKYEYISGSLQTNAPSVLSKIGYGEYPNGDETVSKSGTPTGKAPNISYFESNGLVCASFVSYYINNYLPNIEGVDTSVIYNKVKNVGTSMRVVSTWVSALDSLASSSSSSTCKVTKYTSATTAYANLVPGDVIAFKSSSGEWMHIAIYAGTYNLYRTNGTNLGSYHFIIHVGNSRGPEISTAEYMKNSGAKASEPAAWYHIEYEDPDGDLEIVKTAEDGNVSGITFTITGNGVNQTVTTTSTGRIKVTLKPGSYTVTETVKSGYVADKQSQTVQVEAGKTTTVSFYNSLQKGNVKIVKTSNDGKVSGIQFTVKGTGVNQTVTSGSDGTITVQGIAAGTVLTITELVPEGYACDNPTQTVTVENNKTATVTFKNTLKKGNVKIVKTSDDGKVSGIQFTVKGTGINQTVTSGSDGTITVKDVTAGTVLTITEQVPEGYVCDNPTQTVTVEYNKTTTVTFKNTLKKGIVKIVKTSDDGKVSGIQFTVKGTGVNQTVTSGSDGTISVQGVTAGTVLTITEIVPDGYICDNPTQTVTVEYNKTTTVTFNNTLKKGNVKIVKTSDDGKVSGIQFTVTGTGINQTVTSGTDGTITVQGVTAGTVLTITEKVPDNYVCDNPTQTVTVEYNKTTTVTFKNTLKKGNVKIVKTSDDGKVSGIQFKVTGTGIDQTVTSAADGTITVKDVTAGTVLTITEIVPENYLCDNPTQTVTVEYNKTTTVTFSNTVKKGHVKIVKTSDDGIVGGIQFTVKGDGIDQTVTSKEDGTILLESIVAGTELTITEIVPETHVSDNPSQTVTVEYDKTTTVTFKNTLKRFRVTVTKTEAEPDVARSSNSGVTLEGAVYGLYKDGQLQATYTTDSNYQFTTDYFPCGAGWTLQEISASPGYTVDPTVYEVGAEPGDFTIAANNLDMTVKELIIKGNLQIVKQDGADQKPLAGAKFQVKNSDGVVVAEGYSDDTGVFEVKDLPYDHYECQEVEPPPNYELDETSFGFAVTEDGQTITIERDNFFPVGSITVHKIDTQGKNLSGAGYLLEYSEDGSTWKPVFYRNDDVPAIGGCTSSGLNNGQLITESDGIAFFDGLVANDLVSYRLTEVKAPPGLSLLKDPIFVGKLPIESNSGLKSDISYTITNTRITELPQTGSAGILLPVTIGVLLAGLAGSAGIFFINKKSKFQKEN